MKTRVIAASLLALPVAFCQHTQQPQHVSTFCSVARPILWDPSDTRATKEAVDAHNRAWKSLCKAGKK
jgi:hypothetical protein